MCVCVCLYTCVISFFFFFQFIVEPCPVETCGATNSSLGPKGRLLRLLASQEELEREYVQVLEKMVGEEERADLVLMHGSSANHFDESQGLVQDLHKVVRLKVEIQNLIIHFLGHKADIFHQSYYHI